MYHTITLESEKYLRETTVPATNGRATWGLTALFGITVTAVWLAGISYYLNTRLETTPAAAPVASVPATPAGPSR